MQDIEVRIEKLNPQEGDLLVIVCSPGQAHIVRSALRSFEDRSFGVILAPPGFEFSHLTNSQMNALGWYRKPEPEKCPLCGEGVLKEIVQGRKCTNDDCQRRFGI